MGSTLLLIENCCDPLYLWVIMGAGQERSEAPSSARGGRGSAIPPKNNTTMRPGVPLHNRNKSAPKTPTIYVSTWRRKLAQLGPSTDLKETPRRGTMAVKTILTTKHQFGINTEHNNSRRHATARPDTEGLLTPCALLMKYLTTNSHRALNL